MVRLLRRAVKKRIIKLKGFNSPPGEGFPLLFEKETTKELPYIAILNILDMFKGLFDAFTRYKSPEHAFKDDQINQFRLGLENFIKTAMLIAFIPLVILSKLFLAVAGAYLGYFSGALKEAASLIPICLGLALNSITNLLRGGVQIALIPLAFIASMGRFLASYYIVGLKTLQENAGMKELADEGLKVLSKNEVGSQKKLLKIFERAIEKIDKAGRQHQPIQHENIGAPGILRFEKILAETKLQNTDDQLTKEQFNNAQLLLSWMRPESKPMPELRYTYPLHK